MAARSDRTDKLYLGDVVELRKAHPCGANEWEIIRLGANVKLKCRGCGRVVMLPRSRLTRRIRRFIHGELEAPHVEDLERREKDTKR